MNATHSTSEVGEKSKVTAGCSVAKQSINVQVGIFHTLIVESREVESSHLESGDKTMSVK